MRRLTDDIGQMGEVASFVDVQTPRLKLCSVRRKSAHQLGKVRRAGEHVALRRRSSLGSG